MQLQRAGRRLTGSGFEANKLDAGPEASEGEPVIAFPILNMIRVDGIEVIAGRGSHDQAAVPPLQLARVLIQRGARREPDHRTVGTESGAGVIEVILTIEVRDIRRPHAARTRNRLLGPLRDGFENAAVCRPGHQIGGRAPGNECLFATCWSGAEEMVSAVSLDDARIVSRRDCTAHAIVDRPSRPGRMRRKTCCAAREERTQHVPPAQAHLRLTCNAIHAPGAGFLQSHKVGTRTGQLEQHVPSLIPQPLAE
jgi:hypothetical protein